MTVQTPKRHFTPEEYLELEEKAEYKSEYRDGEIVPMAGGTTNHNQIAGNFYAYFRFALRGQNYLIYIGDVRLWVPRYRQYTYPDVMVIEGEPVYTGIGMTTVTNPSLIVEVLSKSTKNYDQGDKFLYYRSIPELREYILVDQAAFHVMQYVRKAESQWLLSEYTSKEAVFALETVALQIALSDLYEQVNFELTEE